MRVLRLGAQNIKIGKKGVFFVMVTNFLGKKMAEI